MKFEATDKGFFKKLATADKYSQKDKIVIIHKFSGRQSRLSIIFYRVPTELFGGN